MAVGAPNAIGTLAVTRARVEVLRTFAVARSRRAYTLTDMWVINQLVWTLLWRWRTLTATGLVVELLLGRADLVRWALADTLVEVEDLVIWTFGGLWTLAFA